MNKPDEQRQKILRNDSSREMTWVPAFSIAPIPKAKHREVQLRGQRGFCHEPKPFENELVCGGSELVAEFVDRLQQSTSLDVTSLQPDPGYSEAWIVGNLERLNLSSIEALSQLR
jgi:hypothetical protein